MSTNKKNLVNGAVNFNLENGFVLYVSEDGSRIDRMLAGGTDSEKEVILNETFFRAVGFDIDTSSGDNSLIKERDYNILLGIFTIVDSIELSYLKRLVEVFEDASNNAHSIAYIANDAHFIRSMIQLPSSI